MRVQETAQEGVDMGSEHSRDSPFITCTWFAIGACLYWEQCSGVSSKVSAADACGLHTSVRLES